MRFACRTLIWFCFEISDTNTMYDNSNIHFKIISENEIGDVNVIGWLSRKESETLLREQGFILCAAFCKNQIIGNCWLEVKRCDLSFFDMYQQLPNDVAYISRVFVSPEVRNSGIAGKLILFALSRACLFGKAYGLICCVPENGIMLRLLPMLGGKCVGRVSYIRIMWFRLYRLALVNNKAMIWTLRAKTAGNGIFVKFIKSFRKSISDNDVI